MWKKRIAKFFKIIFITIAVLFTLLSVSPYFFSIEVKELDRSLKPFDNSDFLIVKNTRLHYRTFRADSIKQYLMLIHGFSGSTFSFRKNAQVFADSGIFVVAVDLPAFGYSDKSDTATYNESDRVEMLLKIMEKTAAGKQWSLAGHSMGGSVIGQFATLHPEKVKSLIYIDGPAFENDGNGSAFFYFLLKYPPLLRWAEVMAKHKFVNSTSFSELLASAYGTNPDDEAVRGYMQPFLYKGSAGAIFRMSAASGTAPVEKEVLNKFPSLMIWGEQDQWIPMSTGRLFSQQNPSMQTFYVKNAGHCPMETHTEEVNQRILRFLHKLN